MAFPRSALPTVSIALAACSPQGQTAEKAAEPAQAGSVSGQLDHENGAAAVKADAAKPTVVMTRNLKPEAVKTGKPLPHKRIVLKRGQRIDVLDDKGVSSFVGPVTIGPDGQTVSGGGGQEGVSGFGGPGNRIIHIGGVRVDSPNASAPASRPPPPPEMPHPSGDAPK